MGQEQGNGTRDHRRFGVIETRFRQAGKLAMYDLTINGKLWACVGGLPLGGGGVSKTPAVAAWLTAMPSTAKTSTPRPRSDWPRP